MLSPIHAAVSKAPSTFLLTLPKRLARESLVGPQDTSLQLLLESSGRERPRCSTEQAVQFLPSAKCGGLLTIPWGCGGSRGGPSLAGAPLVWLLSRASAFLPCLVICASRAPSLGPPRGTR